MAQELNIVLPQQCFETVHNKETSLRDAPKQIIENRWPIELELKEKQNELIDKKLGLLWALIVLPWLSINFCFVMRGNL